MSVSLLAIDPSVVSLGAAFFVDGELRAAWLTKGPLPTASPPAERCGAMARALWGEARQIMYGAPGIAGSGPDQLVIEWPVVRAAGRGAGDNSDLLLVSGVASAVATLANPSTRVHCPKPEEWKGQCQKDVIVTRVMARLSEAEKGSVHHCAPSLLHNVLEAVGLGLVAVGRMGATLAFSGRCHPMSAVAALRRPPVG